MPARAGMHGRLRAGPVRSCARARARVCVYACVRARLCMRAFARLHVCTLHVQAQRERRRTVTESHRSLGPFHGPALQVLAQRERQRERERKLEEEALRKARVEAHQVVHV